MTRDARRCGRAGSARARSGARRLPDAVDLDAGLNGSDAKGDQGDLRLNIACQGLFGSSSFLLAWLGLRQSFVSAQLAFI